MISIKYRWWRELPPLAHPCQAKAAANTYQKELSLQEKALEGIILTFDYWQHKPINVPGFPFD